MLNCILNVAELCLNGVNFYLTFKKHKRKKSSGNEKDKMSQKKIRIVQKPM